ncbi:hypothetical protein AVEN_134274-1 [Araneus ventricosus]|uniref:Uncharacterized protein n=1 Tax=Araneus ventricosus TaxID=182803 RepID=A0A4Y2KH86_ARAVE|nr:hypothetical protein AVEN_134274-1 [Araneus ventricosus]
MTAASVATSFHVSSHANDLCLMTVSAINSLGMSSLVLVQLRRGIHHSLNRSSENLLCDKCHSIRRRSSIRQGVKKAVLCGYSPLLRFSTVQVATLERPVITAGLEFSQNKPCFTIIQEISGEQLTDCFFGIRKSSFGQCVFTKT